MGTRKNKCLNSNLGLCMCVHEQNRKHQFVMVDPVLHVSVASFSSKNLLMYTRLPIYAIFRFRFSRIVCNLVTIPSFA